MVSGPLEWQTPWTQVPFQVVKLLRAVGWHFAQLVAPPCTACNSMVAWHSEHRWLPETVPIVMIPDVTVAGWLLWFAGAPVRWQFAAAHTSVGLATLTPSWHAAQPPCAAWSAATSVPLVPAVWHPLLTQSLGTARSV